MHGHRPCGSTPWAAFLLCLLPVDLPDVLGCPQSCWALLAQVRGIGAEAGDVSTPCVVACSSVGAHQPLLHPNDLFRVDACF